ncbi:MAG: site-specific integrase [Alphaproteobacteria bacterium]|jgi:integrase|nr:site-specific integrase [Alphaproteobacteria bacterium]MBT5389499.1 site-specific integrase [Alphaproteobacteria bacterium]MBT5540483.1 site-specific integrase [Alphaproteobacteria bacterium]
MQKLTKKIVESIQPKERDHILWDSEISGFMCKVTPAGKKSYFLYYRTHDRRQRRPKIGDHGVVTCEQARNIAQRWILEVTQGKDPSAEKKDLRLVPTLKELADQYMKEHASRKRLSSRKEDYRLWKQHILPTLGTLKASSLDRSDIAKLHHSFQHLPTTGNRVLSLLSKAFNLAELWGYRPNHSNPCLHIKKYTEQKRERFLSQKEIERLMKILEEEKGNDPWAVSAIQLLLITGCRLNEILTLKWEEVDVDNQYLRLRDSKTGKKLIYLSTAALDLLKNIPKKEENPFVICGGKAGAHLINLQKPWRRIRAKAELEDVRLHDLRHTFASIAASKGLSLPIIGALLGHKQTQTTARYAHLIGQPLLEASEKIGKKIMERKKSSDLTL